MIIEAEWIRQKVDEINSQGYTLLDGFLSEDKLAIVKEKLNELLGNFQGRNDFEGTQTERIYTLVARDLIFQEIAEDPRILALCDEFLHPNYLLTASQGICISPGESPQPFHADDTFYTIPRPRPMVSLSTIVAVDAFTATNGGTQVVPGSHLWSDDQIADSYRGQSAELDMGTESPLQKQSVTVEMSAGSCVVFAGTLLHRGGANNGTSIRRAFSNQYCQPWARTQENFFLAIPTSMARDMSVKIQELLGYSIYPPFMGQLSASHPKKALEVGFKPPVLEA